MHGRVVFQHIGVIGERPRISELSQYGAFMIGNDGWQLKEIPNQQDFDAAKRLRAILGFAQNHIYAVEHIGAYH